MRFSSTSPTRLTTLLPPTRGRANTTWASWVSPVGMPSPGPGPRPPLTPLTHSPSADLAPGIDEIYEESQQVFLAPGHPQDGQVVFYKVSSSAPPQPRSLPLPTRFTAPPIT